jgi:hypothetical protein
LATTGDRNLAVDRGSPETWLILDPVVLFGVNADWSCARVLRVSLGAAELRLRIGMHRSVRTRSVTSADDSLTMITATP